MTTGWELTGRLRSLFNTPKSTWNGESWDSPVMQKHFPVFTFKTHLNRNCTKVRLVSDLRESSFGCTTLSAYSMWQQFPVWATTKATMQIRLCPGSSRKQKWKRKVEIKLSWRIRLLVDNLDGRLSSARTWIRLLRIKNCKRKWIFPDTLISKRQGRRSVKLTESNVIFRSLEMLCPCYGICRTV